MLKILKSRPNRRKIEVAPPNTILDEYDYVIFAVGAQIIAIQVCAWESSWVDNLDVIGH